VPLALVSKYCRNRDLARLLPGNVHATPGPALVALLEQEAAENELRLAHAAAYQTMRHIDFLTAIMAEARLLTDTQTPHIVR
jgi:hypothetical protein